jgi:pimeloyl-ACP methyl ester carboxylesterase
MMTSIDSQTLQLPDGRVLGYAEYGDPTGIPILYFHGFPISRLDASSVHAMAARRGWRVISIDRPGYGLSTFQSARRITSWPADVRAFADHAGLSRFAVLGGSGGGPYALACALELPKDMLTSVGVFAGAPPWAVGGMKEMLTSAWLTYLGATYAPAGLRVAADGLVKSAKWMVGTRRVQTWIDGWLEGVVKKNREEAEEAAQNNESRDPELNEVWNVSDTPIPERRERLLRMLFEGFAQGSEAFVQEAQLLTQDWGFKFEDISYDPIRIWHGTRDVNAPVSLIRIMAERLPRSALREYDDDHFSIVKHTEEIIAELVSNETKGHGSTG